MAYFWPRSFAATGSAVSFGWVRRRVSARTQSVMNTRDSAKPAWNDDNVGRDMPDQLDDASRTDLHRALIESESDAQAGRLVDAGDVLRELRRR